jgi:transcriptional regulator with XRE-family HTH domain
MKPDFAAMLYQLRREKNFSQRKAAEDLGVSQALLSHYENGVREPRLEFVVRACEYYGVTTDYILGRTTEKSYENRVTLPCSSEHGRRLADIVSIILSMLGEIGDETLSASAARYLSIASYNVISALQDPLKPCEPLRYAALTTAEADLLDNALRVLREAGLNQGLSDEALHEKYPAFCESYEELKEIMKQTVRHMI